MAITIKKKPQDTDNPMAERPAHPDVATLDKAVALAKIKTQEYMRGYVRGLLQVADRSGSMSMPTRRALLKLTA